MNLLKKTRTYLVGHMQYTDGVQWRQKIRTELDRMNIVVYDPYEKPFVKDVDEGNDIRQRMAKCMNEGDFDTVQSTMKQIRIFDLNLVDRSDFIIAHIVPHVASWGSAEELVTANRAKKPIFLSVEGGKKKCPLWVLGMIPHHYVYNDIDEIVDVLNQLDNGTRTMDSDRWRLLREEFR